MKPDTETLPPADEGRLDQRVVPLVPKRVQLSRAKGWRMPENTVKVDRSTRWGNPYRRQDYELTEYDVPWDVDHEDFAAGLAVEAFEEDAKEDTLPVKRAEIVAALAGKNLACWCAPGRPCHADVLLLLANHERHNTEGEHHAPR